MTNKSENFIKYQNSHAYKRLISKYTLDTFGTWEIYGEDSNCDMGGSHHTPLLEVVTGDLGDVIEYGVNLAGFWQWGGGGDFRKRSTDLKNIPKGYTNAEGQRLKKLAEISKLEEQIAALRKEL